MAILVGIESLLSGRTVEWARIEYKATWDSATSLKNICAFANDIDNWGTGYLVIGVEEESGRPVLPVRGIPEDDVDDVMKDLLNKCKLITPEYLPVVAPVTYGDKTLIVAQCSDGSWRPYSCPARFTHEKGKVVPSGECAYFIRKMSSTVQAQGQGLQDLFALASRIPFDDRTNHEASMSDLNITLIRAYLAEAGSALADEADALPFEELCRNMGICTITPEYVKPRKDGDTLEIVSFPGPDRSVTLEGLRTFRVTNRHYRNRRIGEFLKEIHLTEGRNTGFRKILRALEHNGSPLPEFETDEERGFFITRLHRHPAFAEAADRETTGKSGDNGRISDKISDKVAEHRQRVMELLSIRGHAKTNEIAEELGIKPPCTRQLLAQMVADGIIEAHGERRGRYYCLPESKDMPC